MTVKELIDKLSGFEFGDPVTVVSSDDSWDIDNRVQNLRETGERMVVITSCEEVIDVEMIIPEERGHWEEDEEYPLKDWQYEVANGDTRLGYDEWVKSSREASRE